VSLPADNSFRRSERLKSRKIIAGLFKAGNSYVAYPLRVVWNISLAGPPGSATVVISVSKRLYKTAVQRNRLKRQIREAYRLHKKDFYKALEPSGKHISLMISYIAKEPLPYVEIQAGVKKVFKKFPFENIKDQLP
jgi:ribonuclease P protein component